jgi:pimeloyl-ACP methyl ester carboxylesterase
MNITRRQATVGGLSLLASTALDTPSQAQTATEGVIKLSDASIEYFSQGQGEAVVLLPGGSLTVGYMEGLAQALADVGYRAVRINFRGAGKSTGSGTGVTLHTLAADVAGVIEALKIGPANVAGHAFGSVRECLLPITPKSCAVSFCLPLAVRSHPATQNAR